MTEYRRMLPSESSYDSFMEESLEPALEKIRSAGYFQSCDGAMLYYEYHLRENAVGAVVIAHGYLESAEKFREMVYWFLSMGYSVFALDHRGHGRSYRLVSDLTLTDVGSFADYVKDLHCFVRRIVKPNSVGLPLYLYGHSMGGAVAVLYLEKYPKVFRKAILSSPMLKPKTENIPVPVSRILSGVFRLLGRGDRIVFASAPGFSENESFENSADTSKARFEYYRKKRVRYPYLQNSSPTYRWINEATRITGLMLDPTRCARVKIPVLLCSAGIDTYVFLREQEIFLSLIENGEHVHFETARHEIYMSTNDVMETYLQTIEEFLQKP